MKRSTMPFVLAGLTFLSVTAPALADSAYPTSIDVYRYPAVARPARIPVTVDACGVFRSVHHLHVGFSFRNVVNEPMSAVKISVDLYDPFHAYLTTLDSTINGSYAPGAEIDVPETLTPGDKMPAFEAYDAWPSASAAVCYVSSVLYANGEVWNATSRPDFGAILEAASAPLRAGERRAAAFANSQERVLGYHAVPVPPSPFGIPAGWTTLSTGTYADPRASGGVALLSFVSLTGNVGRGAFRASDVPATRTLSDVHVVDAYATTVCGGRAARFLELRGEGPAGPQVIQAIEVPGAGAADVSAYLRPAGSAANPQAEAALKDLCR